MSTSGSLLPVFLRGAGPGELPVVRWPRPVVPSAQLVDHRAVTTTRSTRLLEPWRTSSPIPYRSNSAAPEASLARFGLRIVQAMQPSATRGKTAECVANQPRDALRKQQRGV